MHRCNVRFIPGATAIGKAEGQFGEERVQHARTPTAPSIGSPLFHDASPPPPRPRSLPPSPIKTRPFHSIIAAAPRRLLPTSEPIPIHNLFHSVSSSSLFPSLSYFSLPLSLEKGGGGIFFFDGKILMFGWVLYLDADVI